LRSHIRLALAVSTLVLIGAPPAHGSVVFDQVTGVDVPSGSGPLIQTQDGRFQTGSPSACSPAKAAPTVESGTFNMVGFSQFSVINEPACVTVSYSSPANACWSNGLFSASYVGGFDIHNIQTNYVGDVGAPPIDPTAVAYSMVVPAGKTLDTLFYTRVAMQGCSPFDIAWASDRPWSTSRPRITGHPFVGETLTGVDGLWPGVSAVTRQWRRCAADGSACVDIPGATGTTYAPAPDDVGHALVFRNAATEAGMSSTSDSAPGLAGIQFEALNGQSLDGSEPTQNGRLLINLFLGPKPSTCGTQKPTPAVTDAAHTRFYDAYRRTNQSESTICTIASLDTTTACTGTQGLASAAYLPAFQPGTSVQANYLADAGNRALVGRTASFGFDVPAGAAYDVVVSPLESGATCPAYDLRLGTGAPYPTSPPSVTGSTVDGQALSASNGGWTGAPTFGYQWLRCFADGSGCSDVTGATGNTYPLASGDVGHSYRVRVTGTEGAGSASKTSAASPPVEAKPPAPYAGIALKRATVGVRPNGVVNLTLSCPAGATLACVGTDTLKLGKQKLGSKSFLIFSGEKAKLKITLSKKHRKLLAKRKKLKATQIVVSHDARRLPITTRAQLTLKKKP
jgi:hypothetical protein